MFPLPQTDLQPTLLFSFGNEQLLKKQSRTVAMRINIQNTAKIRVDKHM